MDANADPDDHIDLDPEFHAQLAVLRNTGWYADIVKRAAAKRQSGSLTVRPTPQSHAASRRSKPITAADLGHYPRWVRDAAGYIDAFALESGGRVLPIRAERDPDTLPDPNPRIFPNGNGGWYPVAITGNSWVIPAPRIVGSGTIIPTTGGGNGGGGGAGSTGSISITAGALPLSGFVRGDVPPSGFSSSGQITLFTGTIPPPGQPYPYGHQHPHIHPRTVASPAPDATYHHSHFHRHDGRISDHSDYNLDQHSHPH